MKTQKKPDIYTTFHLCREVRACMDGYWKLAKHLGGVKKYGETTPIEIGVVLESSGLDYALWCLDYASAGADAAKVSRLFAADCAARVLGHFEGKYPDDPAARNAILTARKFARGKATTNELASAWVSAWASARGSAWGSAWASARASASASARASARASACASASASASARASIRDSAWARAWDEEIEWQATRLQAHLAGTARDVRLPKRRKVR